jgi:hypothetical protein
MPESKDSTEFVVVPGFSDYRVRGLDGKVQSRRIRGSRTKRKGEWIDLRGTIDCGYLCYRMTDDGGKTRKMRGHKVVALTFLGPRPDGMEVCHEDDVKANNSLSNLSYGTRQKNVRDAYRNGRLPVGEDRTDVVLTEDLVERILVRIGTAESQCALGRELGVSQGAISKVVHGINWKHVSGRLGYTFSRSGPLRRPAGPSGDEMGHETSYRSNVGDMALLLCGLYFFTSPQEAGHDPGDRLRRSG